MDYQKIKKNLHDVTCRLRKLSGYGIVMGNFMVAVALGMALVIIPTQ